MFGDGLLGPGGVVWCCALVCLTPALYMAVMMVGRIIPHFTPFGWSVLNVVVAYFFFGYLFGDAVGIIAAVIVFLTTGGVFYAGPNRVVYEVRKRKIMPQHFTFFDNDDRTIDG